MARADGSIIVDTKLDSKGFEGGVSKLKKAAVFGIAGAVGIGAAIVGIGAKFGLMEQESLKADARIKQINKSMGLFGDETDNVSERLLKLADTQGRQIGVDDEIIKNTQAKLLTFKELAGTADEAGGAFDRATTAAFDMASAGFGEAETNAIQLGKALNDPIKGITALARSGVTFTEQEKDKIKTLVESGKTLEAQDMILKAIENQVGGTAEATATSTAKMRVYFDQIVGTLSGMLVPVIEKVGDYVTTKILPALELFATKIADGEEPISAFSDALEMAFGPSVSEKFDAIVDTVQNVITKLTEIAAWVQENRAWLEPLVVGIVAMVAAYKAWVTIVHLANVATVAYAAAQIMLNAAMSANPIGLIVLAIIGLIAAFVYLWKTNEGFRNAVTAAWNAVWGAIKAAASWIATAVPAAFKAVLDFIKKYTPLGFIVSNWGEIRAKIGDAANRAKEAVVTAFQRLNDGASDKLSALVTFVKGLPGKLLAAMGNLKDKFLTIGSDIVAGLRRGLEGKWDGLVTKLKGLANLLPAAVKKLLGIQSPSKVFEQEIGVNMALGIGTGFEKSTRKVFDSMQRSVNGEMARFGSAVLPAPNQALGNVTNSQQVVNFNGEVKSYAQTLMAMRDIRRGVFST